MSGMVTCMQKETRHRHSLPPTHVQKNVNEEVGAEDETANPPTHTNPFLQHASLSSSSCYIGAWCSCDSMFRSPTQHTHALCMNTHIHASHVYTLLPIPRLRCLPSHTLAARIRIPLHTHAPYAHVAMALPAPTPALLQISQ